MGTNFNSGILYGPWTFIYAFGIFGIMLFNKFLNKFDLKKWLEVFIFFIGSAFMMSVIELSGGFLIEKLFHVVYWDYSYMTFNIGSYICIYKYSLVCQNILVLFLHLDIVYLLHSLLVQTIFYY